MASSHRNVVWHPFETDLELDADPEYLRLAERYFSIAGNISGRDADLCCTDITARFLKTYAFDSERYYPGRMLIGPRRTGKDSAEFGDRFGGSSVNEDLSYTHEAVGIVRKKDDVIVAVFDAIRNAPGGQWNVSRASANDRFPLADWLSYKTRLHHTLLHVHNPNRPFCVFVTQAQYYARNSPGRVLIRSLGGGKVPRSEAPREPRRSAI